MPPETPQPSPNDRARADHMLSTARDAMLVLGYLDATGLAADMIRTRALVNCITEIGEAASKLSPEGRALVGDLPWRQIIGMRNVVVHVYWGIDLNEFVKTTRVDLPVLASAIERALAAWPEPEES